MALFSRSRVLASRLFGRSAEVRRFSSADAPKGPRRIDASGYHLNGASSFMRGTVFWEPGKPLTIEEFQMPRPKAGEVLIKTKGKPVYMYSMGGLAEYCVVPSNALALLPDSLPYTESAILGCAVFTAYGAMRHAADLRAGDAVAIIGIGGVGTRCIAIIVMIFYLIKGFSNFWGLRT